jgi:hypothetical protein
MRKLSLFVVLVGALTGLAFLSSPPVYGARAGTGHPMLPRPQLLKVLFAGHLQFSADLYWLGMLQQVGVAHLADDYLAIYDYSELVWTLDDQLRANYRMAALAIPFNAGREQWVNGAEALKVIDHGLKVFPTDVPLLMYRAHTCMFLLHDYQCAGESLRSAAALPGAPPITGLLATRLLAQAGQFDDAEAFAKAMAETVQQPEEKEYFVRRVKEVELERVLTEVDAATMRYWRREGSQPTSMRELIDAHDLDAMPVDPLGGTIALDSFGRARSSSTKYRLELIDHDVKMLTPGGRGEAVEEPTPAQGLIP